MTPAPCPEPDRRPHARCRQEPRTARHHCYSLNQISGHAAAVRPGAMGFAGRLRMYEGVESAGMVEVPWRSGPERFTDQSSHDTVDTRRPTDTDTLAA